MALLRVGESNFFSASRTAGSRGSSVPSFGDLALHAAQRFEHWGRPGAQEDRVVVDVEHPKPSLAPADRGLRPCAVNVGEVVGPDVDPVHTRHRQDLVEESAHGRLGALPELAQRHRLSRAPSLTPLTTLDGSSPSKTRLRLSRTTSSTRASASRVAPPTCGDRKTFSICRSGLSVDVGSCSKTSSAAPPRCPDSRAATSAFSSTTGPREALIRYAPFGMRVSASASMRWWVSSFRGTCTQTTSASSSKSSSETRSTPAKLF